MSVGKYAVCTAFFCTLLCGCSKSASAGSAAGSSTAPAESHVSEKAAVSFETEMISRVVQKMSPRFQEEIVIAENDIPQFLADLRAVLKEEASFRDDDLSLFYLIDKKHSVSETYVPKDLVPLVKNSLFNINRADLSLRPEAYASLKEMSAAAQKDGITLLVSSTYRSYEYQKNLFAHWVQVDGLEEAERESARPGTSQHQLGCAVDFGSISDDFAETRMGRWIYENAADFGWSLSFPKEYEDITGYRWECWHFRYIGKTACAFQNTWFNGVQQYMLEFIDGWKNLQ